MPGDINISVSERFGRQERKFTPTITINDTLHGGDASIRAITHTLRSGKGDIPKDSS